MTSDRPRFPGLAVVSDTSAADWLVRRLWPSRGKQTQVGARVPDVYLAFGRLLHPARSAVPDGPGVIRWSQIAAARGLAIDSGVRFRELAGWRDGPDPPPPLAAPLDGSLDEEECLALGDVLARFTRRPGTVWYCLWDGYGWPELPAYGEGPPRVHLEHEECLLFTGPLTACANFRSGPWFQSPTLWWPDDRAWCVATPIDGFSTYIGGGVACLEALFREPRLEVLPIGAEDPLDPSPYPA